MFINKSISNNIRSQRQQSNQQIQSRQTSFIVIMQSKSLKIKKSKIFKKERFKLRAFITQCELYINFNINQFAIHKKKVLWAASYLRDDAFRWFETYITNVLNNFDDENVWKTAITEMFANWNNFKTFITKMYENIDEIKTAERRIKNLKQLKSAVEYAAKFQQYAIRTQ